MLTLLCKDIFLSNFLNKKKRGMTSKAEKTYTFFIDCPKDAKTLMIAGEITSATFESVRNIPRILPVSLFFDCDSRRTSKRKIKPKMIA